MSDKPDILKQAQDFLTRAESEEKDNRKTWKADVEFARLGKQWPEWARKSREQGPNPRPCLTVNKLGPVIRQVTNDARQNRPAIKVMPQDSKADPETAEVMTGLIRNIEQSSDADVAYDTAIDAAVSGGFGYWRINLEYANYVEMDGLDKAGAEAFEQDICIKRITNPLSVYGDPDSQQADSSDWNQCIVIDELTEAQFKKKWPKAKVNSFDSVEWSSCPTGWKSEKTVKVAEYWVREAIVKQVVGVQMPDTPEGPGEIVVMTMDDWEAKQKEGLLAEMVGEPRPITSYKVTQYIVSGVEVLDTKKWPGQYIPIVPVYGDEVTLDGKRHLRSLIADARGPQEQYNFWTTSATELVALAPRQPYIGPKGSFVDSKWNTANSANHAYIEFVGPVAPQRQPPPSVPASDLQLALNASDDIKSVTGIYDASLGARSNETSGRAIMARQREGDISTFHFIDNLARAIRHTGRILLDLIPKVYATARIVRILGEDGTPKNEQINQPTPAKDDDGNEVRDELGAAVMRIHDFKAGRYDLAVSAGPSYTTKREEAATQMVELISRSPDLMPVIGDLMAKNLDWPGADEIAKRLEKMLPPQIAGENPQVQQMQQVIQQLQGQIVQMQQDQGIEGFKAQTDRYEAETDRMTAVAPAMTPQDIQLIVAQTMQQVLGPMLGGGQGAGMGQAA